MNNDKVKYLIGIINNMDIKDKLRLAIRINETVYTSIDYDKNEMLEKFENRLKELDNEYGNLYMNQYILMVTEKLSELSKEEQNQVVLYLFNTIWEKICKNLHKMV